MTQTKAAIALLELQRRRQAALDAFTPEAASDGHEAQLRVLQSKLQNLILVCSRRAGKTYVCCVLLALCAAKSKNPVSCLYLALTSRQAKKVWRKTWKRVCRQFGLGSEHAETDLTSTFPNGSTVQFGGTDDLRHVQSLLGDSMAGGMAIIDECQSDPGLIESLVEDVLGPMLDETTHDNPTPGRLVLAGTVPPVASGYFWEKFSKLYDYIEHRPRALDELDEEGKDLAEFWEAFNWGRKDNPHETNFEKNLRAYCKKYGLQPDDPIVLRNWLGYCVFDTNETAFRYDRTKNGWKWNLDSRGAVPDQFPPGLFKLAQVPVGVDTFAIGLDPAASADRFAIVMWGWSSVSPVGVWQVAEWSTDKGANAIESQYYAVIKFLVQNYNVVGIVYDPGGSSTTKDPAFLAEYNLVIEPAKKGKGSKKARVDRLKDLLGTSRASIMVGSALEQDLILARFDPEKRALGKYEWTSTCHPDVADAATYAIPHYIEASKKAPKPTLAESAVNPGVAAWVAEQERLARQAYQPPQAPYGYTEPESDPANDQNSNYGGMAY